MKHLMNGIPLRLVNLYAQSSFVFLSIHQETEPPRVGAVQAFFYRNLCVLIQFSASLESNIDNFCFNVSLQFSCLNE